MALLFGVFDPDPHRRSTALAAATGKTKARGGFRCGQLTSAAFGMVWGAAPSVPVDTATGPDGTVAFVMGDIDETGGASGTASHVLRKTAEAGESSIAGLNGHYVALTLSGAGHKAVCGGDVLGLFPIYYWKLNDVCVVASAPGLFRCHPAFQQRIDAIGLASLLLLGHMSGGQCLWRDCRRLEPASALTLTHHAVATERPVNPISPSSALFGSDFREVADVAMARLQVATERCGRGRGSADVMLSGGLDSRLLAGSTRSSPDLIHSAITYGDHRDVEMRCARLVASRLQWQHTELPVTYDSFGRSAAEQVELEAMATTFYNLTWWCGETERLHATRRLLTGFVGDAVMGGSHVGWAYDPATGAHTFDRLFARVNRYGFPLDVVRSVLARNFPGDPAGEVVARLRATFDSFPGHPFQRSWLFDLSHRQRLHVAPATWRLSFAGWSRMPYADRDLLETMSGVPLHFLSGRRLQTELLTERYPDLARLPLDRSDHRPVPMSSTVLEQARLLSWRVQSALRIRPISVFYHRVYDVNNPGWRDVRVRAEEGRELISRVLGPEFLDSAAPRPSATLNERDPVVGTAKNKTLYGLMLLAALTGSFDS